MDSEESEDVNYNSFMTMNSNHNSFTKVENLNGDEIYEYFKNSLRENKIDNLIKLINNNNSIILHEDDSILNQINLLLKYNLEIFPKTIGEASFLQILKIIENNFESVQNNATDITTDNELISIIKNTKLHIISLKFLKSDSTLKKDISISLMTILSKNEELLKLMTYKEVIQKLLNHLTSLINTRYKRYSQHVIGSLQILRRIYIKKIFLRKFFIHQGGVQMLYEFLYSNDSNILNEVLYCFEDLIYV